MTPKQKERYEKQAWAIDVISTNLVTLNIIKGFFVAIGKELPPIEHIYRPRGKANVYLVPFDLIAALLENKKEPLIMFTAYHNEKDSWQKLLYSSQYQLLC